MSAPPPTNPARKTSCGVVVTDGSRLLLGHATGSPRWDIFKGLAEPGETFAQAARREMAEETGLDSADAALTDLGVHAYLPGKALALFAWRPAVLPEPASLVCRSTFSLRGRSVPELDRFALFTWDEARAKVGRNLARVLAEVEDRLRSDA